MTHRKVRPPNIYPYNTLIKSFLCKTYVGCIISTNLLIKCFIGSNKIYHANDIYSIVWLGEYARFLRRGRL